MWSTDDLDTRDCVYRVNRTSNEMMGYRREEMIGRHCVGVQRLMRRIMPGKAVRCDKLRGQLYRRDKIYERYTARKTERRIPVQISISPS